MRVRRRICFNQGQQRHVFQRTDGEGNGTLENVLVLSAYHPEDGETASILVPSFEYGSGSSLQEDSSWRRILSNEVPEVEWSDQGAGLREEPRIACTEELEVASSSLNNPPLVHVSVPAPLSAPPCLQLLQARNGSGDESVESDPAFNEDLPEQPASPPVVVNNAQGVPTSSTASASLAIPVSSPEGQAFIGQNIQFLNFEEDNADHGQGSFFMVASPETNFGNSPDTSSGASSLTSASGNSPGPMFQCRNMYEVGSPDHEPMDLSLDIDNLTGNDSMVAFNSDGVLNEMFSSAPLVPPADTVTVRTTEGGDEVGGIGNLLLGAQFPSVVPEGGLFTRIANMGPITFESSMRGTATTFDFANIKVETEEYTSNGDQFIDTLSSNIPFTGSIIFDSNEFNEANGGSANQISLFDLKVEEPHADTDTSTGLYCGFDYQGHQQQSDDNSEPGSVLKHSNPSGREAFDATASSIYLDEDDCSSSSSFDDDEKNDETYSPPRPKRRCRQKKKARTVSTSTDSGVGVSLDHGTSQKQAVNIGQRPKDASPPPSNKRSRKRGRSESKKTSSSSFRADMGPHLRTISALLSIAGISRQSETVPHEVFRRFKPVDIYRTIQKIAVNDGSSQNSTECVKKSDAELSSSCYNWDQWRNEPLPISDDQSDLPSLIFYPTQAKVRREGDNRISFATKWETDGKPNYSPTVLTSLGSAELNVSVDLKKLARECSNIEVLGDERPLQLRLREPTCIGLMYPSGKLIVVGAMSYHDFRVASRKFARMVQKTGHNVRLNKLSLHLYVGVVKLPFRIDLKTMVCHEDLKSLISYECAECSEIVINVKETSVFCLVCDSGAVLMTGTKKEDLKTTMDMIYPCLRSFGVTY